MNLRGTVRNLAVAAAALLLTGAYAASNAGLEEMMSHDGLKKTNVKGIELAYARPGATLAGYNRVKLEPVEVAFRKDWEPTKSGSRIKLSAEERENIRANVAKLVYEEFSKELQRKDGYVLANEAGPEVLRVKINIVNLYLNAPDAPPTGRSRTYTVSAGEMALFLEMYDSETGEVLARVVDRRAARGSGKMALSSNMANADEARLIAADWARILRNGLDKAHGIGKK